MTDWADTAASQIIILAYGDPQAREQIASLLRYIYLEGKWEGVEAAKQVVKDELLKPRGVS